jgi:hypothetical protein
VRQSLAEDAEDLEAFELRAKEPAVEYGTLVKTLRWHGKL